jgi:predicted porin
VYLKLSYYSPRIHGFQFGVSYTPDGSRNLGEFFGGGSDQRNKQSDIWDFALNYLTTMGQLDVGLSAGFVTGQNERNDSPGFFDDVEDWGAGFNLGYREWTLGGAYRRTNVAGGGPLVHGFFTSNVYDDMHTEFWSVGLRYDTGPWAFGANYIFAREDVPFWTDDQEGQGVEVAVAYTVNENIRIAAGYQHFEFDGPRDQCNTDSGGPFCDTFDGDVGYLETRFSF